jgi:hypothetical protein
MDVAIEAIKIISTPLVIVKVVPSDPIVMRKIPIIPTNMYI